MTGGEIPELMFDWARVLYRLFPRGILRPQDIFLLALFGLDFGQLGTSCIHILLKHKFPSVLAFSSTVHLAILPFNGDVVITERFLGSVVYPYKPRQEGCIHHCEIMT